MGPPSRNSASRLRISDGQKTRFDRGRPRCGEPRTGTPEGGTPGRARTWPEPPSPEPSRRPGLEARQPRVACGLFVKILTGQSSLFLSRLRGAVRVSRLGELGLRPIDELAISPFRLTGGVPWPSSGRFCFSRAIGSNWSDCPTDFG